MDHFFVSCFINDFNGHFEFELDLALPSYLMEVLLRLYLCDCLLEV